MAKAYAGREIEISFWPMKKNWPIKDFIVIEQVKTLAGSAADGRRLSRYVKQDSLCGYGGVRACCTGFCRMAITKINFWTLYVKG